jgi:hypothetical protein
MMVFDAIVTLRGAAAATLGNGAVSTLQDVERGGGESGWPDIIMESWQFAARCLSLALAVVGIVCVCVLTSSYRGATVKHTILLRRW